MAKSIHRAEYDVLRGLLREKRIASGLTQVDVSQRLGRSQSFISDVERGVRRVDMLELRDLCGLFGIRLTTFCNEFERRVGAISPCDKQPARRQNRGAAVKGRKPSRM